MPPLPSPGNVIRISFFTADESGIPAGSRFFTSYTGSAIDQTNITALAASVAAAWGTDLKDTVAETDTLVSVECQDLSSDTGLVGEWTGTTAGTASGQALPANVAVNIGHVIGRHYRGGKPKIFLRAGTVSDLASDELNQWSDSFIASEKTAWQAFVAAVLATANCNLSNIVNVSWYSGFTSVLNPVTGRTRDVPKLRTGSPVIDVITDAIVRPKLGSQRRRLTL